MSDDTGVDVRISSAPGPAPATDRAVVVSADGILHVVQGDRSFAVSSEDADAVLRAAGISSLSPLTVPAAWLDLFTSGTALTPITLQNYGQDVAGTSLRVGQVVRQAGAADDERFLVQTGGVLEALSPLAWQLYQLGSGSALGGQVTEVTADEIRSLPTAAQGLGDDWPRVGFETVPSGQRPCAVLQPGEGQAVTALATQPASTAVSSGVRVDPSHGALVRAGRRGRSERQRADPGGCHRHRVPPARRDRRDHRPPRVRHRRRRDDRGRLDRAAGHRPLPERERRPAHAGGEVTALSRVAAVLVAVGVGLVATPLPLSGGGAGIRDPLRDERAVHRPRPE